MSVLFCPLPGNPCQDPASPITNFSAESPDRDTFLSRNRGSFGLTFGTPFRNPSGLGTQPFPGLPPDGGGLGGGDPPSDTFVDGGDDPQPPGTNGFVLPPLGSMWFSDSCGGQCTSNLGQEDADLCAAMLGVSCLSDNWIVTIFNPDPNYFYDILIDPGTRLQYLVPHPPGRPPIIQQPQTVFTNQEQSCTVLCEDGTPFTFTVVAGKFMAYDQATANAQAHSFACAQANKNKICMGVLNPANACLGLSYSGAVVVSGRNFPVDFAVIAGAVPPGMVISGSPNSFILSGICNVPGNYTFTLQATDSLGFMMTRTYTLPVEGISTTVLDDLTPHTPYTFQLVAANPQGAVTWAIVSGALPDGLVLDVNTGTISGIFDHDVDMEFSTEIGFQMQDSAGIACVKNLFITVLATSQIDWSEFNGLSCVNAEATVTYAAGTTSVLATGTAAMPSGGLGITCTTSAFVHDPVPVNIHYKLSGTMSGDMPVFFFAASVNMGCVIEWPVDINNNPIEFRSSPFLLEGDHQIPAGVSDDVCIGFNWYTEGLLACNWDWTLELTITPL